VRYMHAMYGAARYTMKITYSLLPRNNRQKFPCSRYQDRSALYCNKLPDQGINYIHFREILQEIC